MWLTLDDLSCPKCGAFVHPLLDACPSCRAVHASRRDEAAAGAIGAVRLAEAPETQRVARNLTVRYTMKVNAIGKDGSEATLEAAVAHLADALAYRMTGDAVQPTDDAALALRDGALVAQRRSSGALLAEIPLRVIVGAAARHAEVTLAYAAAPATGPGGAPAGVAGTSGPLFLTVANRRGLLASRARDDHFEALARWLGVLATAAAERRWMEVGLPTYLAELGPAAGGPLEFAAAAAPHIDDTAPASAAGAIPVPSWPPGGDPAHTSVQASLVELESLRTAGLVADDEYAAKRQEILARL